MPIFKFLLYSFLPGLNISLLKRYVNLDLQKYFMPYIKNPQFKGYVEKYLGWNDKIVANSEKFIKNQMDKIKTDGKSN